MAVALAALPLGACDSSFTNPNAATEDQVLASTDGLLGLVNGTRREYSVGPLSCLYNAALADGLTTRSLYVLNTGNGELAALEAGRDRVNAANAHVTNVWTSCALVNKNASLLIASKDNVPDAHTAASIQVAGHFYKALAIGTTAQFFTHVVTTPVTAAQYLAGERAAFTPRAQALTEAITLLTQASSLLAAQPGGTTSAFFNQKTGTAIDYKNALLALTARYRLMAGDNDGAITAAAAVDLTKRSTWTYDAVNQNPLYRSGFVSGNVVGGNAGFGLPAGLAAETGDARTAFYLGNTSATVRVSGFFRSDTDAIPVYLPGEMLLIQAEAYARKNDLATATTFLNRVRTKTAAQDVFGVGANLPAYSGPATQDALLAEIYRQRVIELYLQGLRLEDARRLARPGPETGASAERLRSYLPFPQTERDGNPNTPTDPAAPAF